MTENHKTIHLTIRFFDGRITTKYTDRQNYLYAVRVWESRSRTSSGDANKSYKTQIAVTVLTANLWLSRADGECGRAVLL